MHAGVHALAWREQLLIEPKGKLVQYGAVSHHERCVPTLRGDVVCSAAGGAGGVPSPGVVFGGP